MLGQKKPNTVKRWTLPTLMCALLLSGCATPPAPIDCPKPPPLPSHISKPEMPSFNAYSIDVQVFLTEALESMADAPSDTTQP